LKISDADSAENDPASPHQIVTALSCALPPRRAGGPKSSGEERLKILAGTRLRSICGSVNAAEQYYCNFGVNQDYEQQLRAAGLRVSARGIRGEARAVELPDHRFFIATLFQPQLSSRPEAPHRLWIAFLRGGDPLPEGPSQTLAAKMQPRKHEDTKKRFVFFLRDFVTS
jgi:CTP synthase (UTP-ammonia lyase)